jgi:hypothetical protein
VSDVSDVAVLQRWAKRVEGDDEGTRWRAVGQFASYFEAHAVRTARKAAGDCGPYRIVGVK